MVQGNMVFGSAGGLYSINRISLVNVQKQEKIIKGKRSSNQGPALLHKKSYFRKHQCVNINVTLQRRKKAAEGTYDDNTKQERIIESNAPTLSESKQGTKNTDT